MRAVVSLGTLLLTVGSLYAQSNAKVPDTDPEVERKSFIVAPGFEVNLFAADPLLAKPIQMNFDNRGRLWVATSEVYPQIQPGQKANDKIIILEDTKGVGKADKVTVFADGLLIPTGIEPGDGGAYVANSTELLHLKASKADGKADRTEVVLSGFGTEDTHHILHTLRWGPEGLLYFNQSIYIHSHIETPHGVRRLNGGGIWHFRPETMELEVFLRGFVNTWGHHFDRSGQSLVTDGANGEGITHGIPGAYYPTAVGGSRILHGMNPGSPKHCGLEVISGSHMPEEYRGNVLTNDFRGHRVCRFVLRDEGSSYISQEKTELIKTNHGAFRPIDIKMGPDGAIYVADWYNPIIQHGEVDFRDPRRDHTHGRIWRITAKDRPLVKKPDLVGSTIPQLLEVLKSPEDWNRHFAKRTLKERGAKAVLPELTKWLAALPADAPEGLLLEALWTYQSLDTVESDLLKKLLHAKDYHVRSAATRVLTHWQKKIPEALEYFSERVVDESPRVRMEAVRGLTSLKTPKAFEVAMRAVDLPLDKVLDYSLFLTAKELESVWMPAFREGKLSFGGSVRQLTFALSAAGSKDAVPTLLKLLRDNKVAPENTADIWGLVANAGTAAELQTVLDTVLTSKNPVLQARLLTALEETAQRRKLAPAGDNTRIRSLLESTPDEVLIPAIRLAGLWKLESLRKEITTILTKEDSSPARRRAAVSGLVLLGGDTMKVLEELFTSTNADLRRLALVGLVELNPELAAKSAVILFKEPSSPAELEEVFTAFLKRKGAEVTLKNAIAKEKLPPETAKLGLKAIRNSGQDFLELAAALNASGGLSNQNRELTPAQMLAFVAEVQKSGDPARGEEIYRRKDMACLKCHGIGGVGGQVGPDMTSIGASAQIDYLVESILLPNKAVKENYNALTINTLEGKVLSGIKIRETKDEIVLRDAEDRLLTIAVKDIEEKKNSRSLMPDGLADTLTRAELVDLVRFMSELGKVGPYSLSKGKVLRRWQTMDNTPSGMTLFRQNGAKTTVSGDPAIAWSSAYSRVSGELPLSELPSLTVFKDNPPLSVARGFVEVTTAGKMKLKLNSATGVTLWVGTTPIEVQSETEIDLKPGTQSLTFVIDRTKRTEPLRAELEEIEKGARAAVVGGK